MKLLVFGAMGRTGKAVVERATSQGHEVTVFVRGTVTSFASNLRVVNGDVRNKDDVDFAMQGQEAVIDTIGGKTPWKYSTLESSGARMIVASMQANHVRRLVATSMLGVGESKRNAPIPVRLLLLTYLRGADQDKSAMERVIEASKLDWTILRPAVLTDGPSTGDLRVFRSDTSEKAHKTTRSDLATFMIDQLPSSAYVHKFVTVANS